MEPPLQLLSSPSSPCNALAKQTSARQNPMLLPEIITRVGQFLPLWSSNGFAREFNPLPLLHCALVSHTFRACLLPTLWYLYDGYSMRNIPQNILIKYSPLFRIISNTGPFKGPFLCKNLIELSTVYGQEWSRDLLVSNPGLKRLVWGGPFHRRIETLEQQQEWELELKALMGLENLDEFRTSGFSLGEGIFVKVLRNNAARLSNLVMSTVAGVTSIEGLELPHLSELQVTFGCPESPALVDLVRCCPRLQRLSLVGSKIKSFSPAPHHHHNNHHFQAAATNDQSDFEVLRLAKNIAECCPELSSIKFSTTTGLPPPSSLAHALRSHCFLNGAECAALVDATRRLEHFSADLLTLDFALTEALVGQRASLKSLKLSIHGGASATTSVGENDMYHATERIKEIHCLRRLKASLAALEELSLTLDYGPLPAIPAAATVLTPPPTTAFALASASTSATASASTATAAFITTSPSPSITTMRGSDLHEEMVAFFEEPWACLDLESLVLNGLLTVPINSSCSSTEPGAATSTSPSTPTSNLNTASEKGLASMVRWRPAKTFDNNSSAPPRHFHNPSELEETIRLLLLSTDPLTKLRQLSVNCATFERVITH